MKTITKWPITTKQFFEIISMLILKEVLISSQQNLTLMGSYDKDTNCLTIYISKVSDLSRGWPEGSFYNCYYTDVLGRALFHNQDCFTLPLIITLLCWVLRKAVSSTIFWVFVMTQPGIEPQSSGPLANTPLIRPIT